MVFPIVLSTLMALGIGNGIQLQQISADTLTNPQSFHKTEVGPVILSNPNNTMMISEFLVGRNTGDGAPAMGITTFSSKGPQPSLLPGLTQYQNPAGPYSAVSFPSVAWNAEYNQWLLGVLPITGDPDGGNDQTHAPVVLQSSNGVNWSKPIPVAPDLSRPEKNIVVCDNHVWQSPYAGYCYVVWDDNGNNDLFHSNTSTNAGTTWGPTQSPPDNHSEYGAVPIVQPNGGIVVSAEDGNGYDGLGKNIISFVSTNGGSSWSAASEVSPIQMHTVAANMRTQALPSSAGGGDGKIYTVWQDCRFRTNCSSNDIVLTVSKDGHSWTSPARIPLDSVNSGVDHFLPTINTLSTYYTTNLILTYYYFPQANCTVQTCQLDAAVSLSTNGGYSWSTPVQIAGPISLSNLPLTSAGYMVGDYFGTEVTSSYLFAPLSIGLSPSGGYAYNEGIYLPESCNWNCDPTKDVKGLALLAGQGAKQTTIHQLIMGRLQPERPAPRLEKRAPRSRV